MNPQYRLDWQGPFTFRELLSLEAHKASFSRRGVYLWTDSLRNNRIYYVGKASGAPNLWKRQWQHYTGFIGGHYDLPSDVRPALGRWVMIYGQSTVIETVFDEEKFVELVRAGFRFSSEIRIYLCPLDSNDLAQIERQLIFELQPLDTTRGTKYAPQPFLDLVHHNAKWASAVVRQQIRSTVRFAATEA